ncbi:MAG TPA: hypothetical protein VFF06_01655 [Polyangia bacterium]|nr:hypothetical protein [Polyangia bacterium]
MPRVLLTAVALLLQVGAAGCHRRARSADEAFKQVERAVAAGDALALYDLLDAPTRAAVKDAFHDEALERTIISAKYPESEQPAALAKLDAAAAPDVEHYFARVAGARKTVEGFRKRLGSVSGPILQKPDGDAAVWVARQDGMPFHFRRDADGSWGFSELSAEWALEKDRANHAVKTVRDNASLFGANK